MCIIDDHFAATDQTFNVHLMEGTDNPYRKLYPFYWHMRTQEGVYLKPTHVTLYIECTTIGARAANECWGNIVKTLFFPCSSINFSVDRETISDNFLQSIRIFFPLPGVNFKYDTRHSPTRWGRPQNANLL